MRDPAGVLKLFTERRAFYSLAEARRLANISAARLDRAIAEMAVEPVTDETNVFLSWEDVVSLALKRWTPRQIAHILRRTGQSDILPALNQYRTIQIELPLYQIRLLHSLARQRHSRGAPPLAVSDVLEYELGALAFEENVAALAHAIPGFVAAANYPLSQDGPTRIATGCLFCGAGVRAEREACAACVARHVPVDTPTV